MATWQHPRVTSVVLCCVAYTLLTTNAWAADLPGITTLPARAQAAATMAAASSEAASATIGKPTTVGKSPAPTDADASSKPAKEPDKTSATAPETTKDTNEDSVFIPTEEISEDFAVSFPVDI